jgi:D-3-phosphoglycerate dehydrogenase
MPAGVQGNVPPGMGLAGKTLGLVGLGRIGGRMADYARAIGMRILAWSTNLTGGAGGRSAARSW